MRAAALLLAIGCASGQHAAVRGAHSDLDYFVGTWRADIVNPQDGKKARLDYRIEPVLGGAWYVGSGSSKELGVEINDYWGRDSATKEIVRSLFDSHGTIGVVRSKGWQGDRLVFEGDGTSGGERFTVRETITKVGGGEFTAVWEQKTPDGWRAYSVERLVRVR